MPGARRLSVGLALLLLGLAPLLVREVQRAITITDLKA
jgi:hypothetical protein